MTEREGHHEHTPELQHKHAPNDPRSAGCCSCGWMCTWGSNAEQCAREWLLHLAHANQPYQEPVAAPAVETDVPQRWISVKESFPPTGCAVFTCKGKDVGIGVYMAGSGAWHNLSGHSMVPDRWATIQFPDTAEASPLAGAQPQSSLAMFASGGKIDSLHLNGEEYVPLAGVLARIDALEKLWRTTENQTNECNDRWNCADELASLRRELAKGDKITE